MKNRETGATEENNSRGDIIRYIQEDLEKLTDHEIRKVYRFIRKVIAEIPAEELEKPDLDNFVKCSECCWKGILDHCNEERQYHHYVIAGTGRNMGCGKRKETQ